MTTEINFEKYAAGLVPAIIQDAATGQVSMLGFMNADAFAKTLETGLVTFFSRSRQRLWTKGETSGNFLRLKEYRLDCDRDTILITAEAAGPVCHTGERSCFGDAPEFKPRRDTLGELERVIASRAALPDERSYTSNLLAEGINRVAQKVGEEAFELVIEAKDDDAERFKSEAADLLFHLLVLLRAKGVKLTEVYDVLESRRR